MKHIRATELEDGREVAQPHQKEKGTPEGCPDPLTHIKALTRALLRSWASGDRCGTGLAAPTLRAEVRSPPQEADSQYIEEGSLSKRMFSYVTFPNSFLSFPAS